MNARTAARELALLTLFQIQKKGQATLVPENKDLNDLILEAVRLLSMEAQESINEAVHAIQDISLAIQDKELHDESNLSTNVDALLKPIDLPNTQETVAQLDQCLKGAELLNEALRIPEISALARTEDVQAYVYQLIETVIANQAAIDDALNECTEDWRVERLSNMDASILRLAAAEMQYIAGVDHSVSINEAVDLAKMYSEEQSYKFVNGILGGLAKKLLQGAL